MDGKWDPQKEREFLRRGRQFIEKNPFSDADKEKNEPSMEVYHSVRQGVEGISEQLKKRPWESELAIRKYKTTDKNTALKAEQGVREVHKLRRNAKRGRGRLRFLTFLEGGGFESFGLGFPNLPLFTSSIIMTIYEVGRSFGFKGVTGKDLYFLLKVAEFAFEPNEKKLRELMYLAKLTDSRHLDKKIDLDKAIEDTSKSLSMNLPYQKAKNKNFPRLSSGLTNEKMLRVILDVASFAYELRYLGENRR